MQKEILVQEGRHWVEMLWAGSDWWKQGTIHSLVNHAVSFMQVSKHT